MLKIRQIAVLAAGLLAAALAQAGCYTVFNQQGEVLSQTSTPPVNMAYQLHETVPERFGPGAHMMFGLEERDCGPLGDPFAGATGAQAGSRGAVPRSPARRRARHAPRADRG